MQLDYQLVYQARRLINGANVHNLEGLIYAYELAVDLNNKRGPEYEIDAAKYERELRAYVARHQRLTAPLRAA